MELAASSVVHVVVAVVYEGVVAIAEMAGGVLRTVTLIEDVARLPEVSAATALSVYDPSGVEVPATVFHVVVYGEDNIADPIFVFPTLNWTSPTATLSVAVAKSVTMPPTVAPFAGAVSDTVGGVVSPKPMTFTVAVHVPVAPELLVTVSVYVVVVKGVTFAEPDSATEPTLGSDAETAFDVDHIRSELSPSVIVGFAAVMLQDALGATLAPPPPPKPAETRVTVLSDDGLEECGDVEGDCVFSAWLFDCWNDPDTMPTLDAPAVPDASARVSGPKYPLAGRSCAAWYSRRAW